MTGAGGMQGPAILTAWQAIFWIAVRLLPKIEIMDLRTPEAGGLPNAEFIKAERELNAALVRRQITARGLAASPHHCTNMLSIGDGPLVEIPSLVFEDLRGGIWARGVFGTRWRDRIVDQYPGPYFTDIQFRSEDVLRLWPPHAAQQKPTVSRAQLDNWLLSFVAAHPKDIPTKNMMRRALDEAFPDHVAVTQRRFNELRSSARVPEEWRKNGRKPGKPENKSNQKKSAI